MVAVTVTLRGLPETEKFFAELQAGARAFGGTVVSVGTALPRGLFTDVGTKRGTPATHWLSGLRGQAATMVTRAVHDRTRTPTQLAQSLETVGAQLVPMARGRARQRTGQLRRSIKVAIRRGPGGRL